MGAIKMIRDLMVNFMFNSKEYNQIQDDLENSVFEIERLRFESGLKDSKIKQLQNELDKAIRNP